MDLKQCLCFLYFSWCANIFVDFIRHLRLLGVHLGSAEEGWGDVGDSWSSESNSQGSICDCGGWKYSKWWLIRFGAGDVALHIMLEIE